MGAYTRLRLGYDSSGRPIDTDKRQKQAFDQACKKSGVTPTIVQGAYRAGNGAVASASTHDGGGVFDLRTWNLTTTQRQAFQRASRSIGGTCWYRTPSQGFDYHMHDGLLGHKTASSGLKQQFSMYKAGYNGLASWGRDDFWRPSPIPTFRYKKAAAKPRVNLTHLQRAYKRKGGRVYNPWGRKAVRLWVKHLRKHGYTVKGFQSKAGWFGKHVRRATAKFSKNHNLKYGQQGWPSWAAAKKLGLQPYRVKIEKRPNKPKIKKWGPVNRARVNKALKGGPIDKVTKKQMNRVVWALRAQRGKAAATGYKKHPRAALRRAIRKFQLAQGWRGNDADGLLGPETCRRLKHLKNVK